jgi:hypothetical protein
MPRYVIEPPDNNYVRGKYGRQPQEEVHTHNISLSYHMAIDLARCWNSWNGAYLYGCESAAGPNEFSDFANQRTDPS